MIEKVTLMLEKDGTLMPTSGIACQDTNPKALLLYAAAKCAALTALHIMERERVIPQHFQITVTGDLSTDTVTSASMFRSFHALYNVDCATAEEQLKAGHAVRLTQEKHCSMMEMLRRIAPVTYKVAITNLKEAANA